MIVPCPHIPRRWSDYPVTLALIAANVFIFMAFFSATEPLADVHLSDRDLRTAGRLFLQETAGSALADQPRTPERLEIYGQMALRDARFLGALQNGDFAAAAADPLALRSLTEKARRFHDELGGRTLHRFGLSSERQGGLAWLTYQFSHAGAFHLLSNLVFLLILGLAIEARWGGLVLGGLYLLGGLAGGWAYLQLDPHGVIPMVGASGSVSALIAAYPLLERRRNVRFYYFLFPMRGQHGFIHLPVFWIFPLYLFSDVASLIASPAGLGGGVAYSAHVGGAILGLVAAGCLALRRTGPPHSQEEDAQV